MTLSEIGALAERLFLYEKINDDVFLIKAVDSGQKQLPAVAFRETEIAITVADNEINTWKFLPIDFVQATEIKKGSDAYSLCVIRDSKIQFEDAGYFIVRYRRYPSVLSSVANVPEVNEAYHHVLAKYVAAQYFLATGEDKGTALLQEFYAEAARVAAILRRAARFGAPVIKVERGV